MTASTLRLDRARTDYAALGDRLRYLLALRVAIVVLTVGFALASPGSFGIPTQVLEAAAVVYLAFAVGFQWIGHRVERGALAALSAMLLLDGVYLALATYATGGTESPMRFLVYLQLVAVSLLASYRTGLKIALWHSLLLFVVLYAQAAALVPAVDVEPGHALDMGRLPVLNVTAFWLFALATSVFSAMNERELRQRRADLEALVAIGGRLDDEGDPILQAGIVLDGLVDRYAFPRGLLLGVGDEGLLVLGSHGIPVDTRTAVATDPVVERAWKGRVPVALRRLPGGSAPALASLLPRARQVILAPMVADGRPLGVLVLEYRNGRLPGVERRVMGVVAQVAAMTALNLRNAVLLRRVQDLAERDALTGAANRRSFTASLERVVASRRAGDGRTSAVLFIDLDDFKIVNDTLGHAIGDELLVAVTRRIGSLIRDGDVLARLGGDEFAILTEDLADLRRARAMAERLVRELRAPYLLGGHPVSISASIGIAGAHDAVDGAADLVRNADVAMYMAKAGGKAGFAIFDPGMHHAIRERHELAIELQQAVELDQLELRYQPIVDLRAALSGVEALVRWRHPERGLIAPGQFIEIAEEHGSILPIGRWVLREACRQAAEWAADGETPPGMYVAVNVSAREVQESGFVAGVREALSDHGVAATGLVIEITETALLRATPSTIATLQGLRDLGVRVVIDDFGTGYFSLSHLRQFPVTRSRSPASSPRRATPRPPGGPARWRGDRGDGPVARHRDGRRGHRDRGAGRLDALLDCTYGQGYYFARPLLPADLPEVARETVVSLAEEAAAAEAAAEVRASRSRARRRAADAASRWRERPEADCHLAARVAREASRPRNGVRSGTDGTIAAVRHERPMNAAIRDEPCRRATRGPRASASAVPRHRGRIEDSHRRPPR